MPFESDIKFSRQSELLIRQKYGPDGNEHVKTYLRLTFRKHIALIRNTLKLPKGSRVLDVGCGTGQFLVELAQKGFHEVGIDTFEEVDGIDAKIAQAKFREAGHTAKIVCGNATYLPFPDKSFDLVTNFGMLEHMPLDARSYVLREMFRVVRPSGYLFVIAGPNRACPYDQHIPRIPFANWLPRRIKTLLAKRTGHRLLSNPPWNLSRKEFHRALPKSQVETINLYSAFLKKDAGQVIGSFRLSPIWFLAYCRRRWRLHKLFGLIGYLLAFLHLEHCHILAFKRTQTK